MPELINANLSAVRVFACISFLIGAIECFAGFKILKTLMAVWGLFVGAMLGVIAGICAKNATLGIVLVLFLGAALAFLSFKFYLAGVFILTTFLSTVTFYLISEHIIVAILLAVIVGLLAIKFVKPVMILTTAVSGAGIILFSAFLIVYKTPVTNHIIMAVLWVPIALTGIAVQYLTTQKPRHSRGAARAHSGYDSSLTFSERKYPGMQRAYRNFCIKCGCELMGSADVCPRCGYSYDER